MNKEEIKHFKALLRQGSLRHMNILLDDKFQKELLNIIKDYEKLQQENQELKKQVEEYKEQVNKGLYNTCLPYTTGYNKAIKDKETQQKEFIKYIEDESKEVYRDGGLRQNIFRQILQKYKEIIGVSDEKEN